MCACPLYREPEVANILTQASQLGTCSAVHLDLDSYTPCQKLPQSASSKGWYSHATLCATQWIWHADIIPWTAVPMWVQQSKGLCLNDQKKSFTVFCWHRSIKISSSTKQEEQTQPWTSCPRSFLTKMPCSKGGAVTFQGCVLAHQDVLMSIAHVPCSVAKQVK